jgi:predicted O-methyltransferase YrrM
MRLPTIAKTQLDLPRLDLRGLPTRYMHPGELEVLVALIASVKPKAVAEFGVNAGRTAKVILDHLPGIEAYHGWDVLPGYAFECEVQAKEIPARPGLLATADQRFMLHLSSAGTFGAPKPKQAYVDAVFIDGDHSRRGVIHDTSLARAMVRPGGIIVWHDYHDLGTVGVRDVLDEMYSAGADIRHVEGTWLAFERIPAADGKSNRRHTEEGTRHG